MPGTPHPLPSAPGPLQPANSARHIDILVMATSVAAPALAPPAPAPPVVTSATSAPANGSGEQPGPGPAHDGARTLSGQSGSSQPPGPQPSQGSKEMSQGRSNTYSGSATGSGSGTASGDAGSGGKAGDKAAGAGARTVSDGASLVVSAASRMQQWLLSPAPSHAPAAVGGVDTIRGGGGGSGGGPGSLADASRASSLQRVLQGSVSFVTRRILPERGSALEYMDGVVKLPRQLLLVVITSMFVFYPALSAVGWRLPVVSSR